MPIRFAPARDVNKSPVARILQRPVHRYANNDNGTPNSHDMMLNEALRHFAEFGLSAPQQAREYARVAFFAGDRKAYDWWREICRILDTQIAKELNPETLASSLPTSA
jgi:hypothetical protein